MSNTKRCSSMLLGCAISSLLFATAQADVTIEEKMSVSGAGLMTMMNMSGKTVTAIAGDRARTDSDLQFESGILRTFASGAGQGSEIVRLDRDTTYSLDHKKKSYTEMTFAEQRAQMERAMQQMEQSQAQQQQQTSGVDESECEWSPPKVDVTRGEKGSIAGYYAERVSIFATQSCTNRKTQEVCDFGLLLDQWVAADFPASNEVQKYHLAYAEKMGFSAAGSREFASRAQTMFGRYTDMWKEVAAKMGDVKEHPVKSSFGLGVGGPQCTSAQEAQAAGGPGGGMPNIGGAIGGALGGMFGRKKESAQPAQQAAPAPTMPGGLVPLMTVSTELLSVNTGSIPDSHFDVPAGYKKSNR